MPSHPHLQYGNLEMIKDVWSFVKPYRKKFFFGSFLRVTSDIVWLFPPFALSEIITFASQHQPGESTAYFWKIIIILIFVALYHFIFHDVCKNIIYPIAEQTEINAYVKSVRHMFDIDQAWHEKENSGNKIQKIAKGSGSLNGIIRVYIDLVVESTINLIAITIIFYTLNWRLNLILIVFFVSYYLLSYFLTQKAVLQSHKANVEWENFGGIIFEAINNISIIKSLRIGDKILPFITKISRKLFREIKKRVYYYRMRGGVLNLYQEFFRLGIVAFTGWQILQGNLEVGVIAMVLFYFGKIEASAYEFSETYSQFVTAKIAIFRMKEILNEQPTVEKSGHLTFNHTWETLKFENVSFAYHGKKVIKNFSLSINKGEKIGIVGISGTGKSTLFKLILKLYNDYKGDIKFDDLSLKDLTRKSYLEKVAVVPQETELFNLTLQENIILSSKKPNKKLLKTALDISHVKDFSHKLPQGLDSLIGEKGIKLSGGEKQRLGIARAIYKQPDLLLLDEATSHLDIESERKIQDALHKFFKNITAIVIAHRLSTIKEMDKIVVMDQGRVREIGAFQELMRKKSVFYKLWEKQKF